MSDNIQIVDDNSFNQEVLLSNVPVVVDFWAPWCGPCRTLLPVIEEVAVELGSKVKVVKVSVDDSQTTAANYGIRGVPTIIIFKNGEAIATKVGSLPKNQLIAFIESNI